MNKSVRGISIIVCSIDPVLCENLKNCIAETIGVDFEFIAFDNRQEKYGICKVYNHCAKKAVYPYLCFIHEDIKITTKGWGETLIKFAESTPNCGVIGIAGGTVAYKNFLGWADGRIDNEARYRYWDTYNDGAVPKAQGELVYKNCNPNNADFTKIVTLDGCFLFIAKNVYAQKPFDENTFTQFHFYDADFTLGIALVKQNYVCYKIDVYHFSKGTYKEDYFKASQKFQIKWRNILPLAVENSKISINRELFLAVDYIYVCYQLRVFRLIESVFHSIRVNGIIFFCRTVFYYCIRKLSRMR